ncbi:MAG: hypothetical protein APG12_00718 [Candidatus Methanofastidiosum methylothiophilum]|uniref:Ribosome assembly factor SBDS n=1 Tax=Candidatus Methanofastidiosum methylothiophilum TaxID=1705564 RepID=A0A150ILM1_9EURY|nr:MAG: hypothetical protein APG10_00666 [Candidatus Methanofastidiosum methylthiophilus]KYC47966.1 MAG: hypothetical protein APG11_00741 [Candidatus Methanofastidiosum methylthiophilus]KYC50584.1 MAG: hypothetical protein APG12_00718 [Candidatus Methanofastidiosum methylthiophilus]
MISLDDAVTAKLKYQGEHFEILVDPKKAQEFKGGNETDDFLAANFIFKDANKGDKASPESLKKAFGTDNVNEISKIILKKGEIHLTTDQRRAMMENKRAQIVSYISRHSINPQTGHPHPPQRIETALEEARVTIDMYKRTEDQIKQIIHALAPIIPIKIENRRIGVKVPAEYAPKTMGFAKTLGTIIKEEWGRDGSWMFVIEIPAGLQDDLFNKLNSATKGNVETKIMDK